MDDRAISPSTDFVRMQFTVPFVLASGSPRRKHLLDQLGLSFEIVPSGVAEDVEKGLAPEAVARTLARRKAAAVASDHPASLVLAADTIVVHREEILNKPADAADAAAMLSKLSGTTHEVITGIALEHRSSGRVCVATETTQVRIATLSDKEISAYVATGSPLDKAGSYGIQDDYGAPFVEGIVGDYYNVVGLPLHRLYQLLQTNFADLLESSTR